MRVAVALCLSLTLLVSCQPAGGPSGGATQQPSAGPTGRALGAPAAGMPASLSELLDRGHRIAEEWQDEPVLAEVEVQLDDQGRWTSARLQYLAAEADRFLALTTAGSGFSQELPSLGGLQLQPVPGAALDELPPFPDDAVAPDAAAEGEAAGECGAQGAVTVLYTTGAPYAWDGTAWSEAPQWRATVAAADGTGARLDIRSGAPQGCL